MHFLLLNSGQVATKVSNLHHRRHGPELYQFELVVTWAPLTECHSLARFLGRMGGTLKLEERVVGFEPTHGNLEGSCRTAWLYPHVAPESVEPFDVGLTTASLDPYYGETRTLPHDPDSYPERALGTASLCFR